MSNTPEVIASLDPTMSSTPEVIACIDPTMSSTPEVIACIDPTMSPTPEAAASPYAKSDSAISTKSAFTVCVFCGSSPGKGPAFVQAAKDLAGILAENSWHLVYGGGTVGLMGVVSSTLISLSGPSTVLGVVPKALIDKEQEGIIPPETEFGKTMVVKDMHTRKAMMAKQADAFVALPGGFGTLDELFEIVTWNQLGIHDKPIVLLNINGFYDGLLTWINKAIESGFVNKGNRDILVEAKSADEVEEKIKNYKVTSGRYILDWDSY
ncbi:hypothetical protein BGX38DRAFT_1327032 [Terfezia claveryi]|nr:hypothetical protein BGX38DRAFT_1327032 [Terfezia claveryi]